MSPLETSGHTVPAPLALGDWRRRIATLYAEIRAMNRPDQAWAHWKAGREALFRSHPQSPLTEADRARFDGIATFDYAPELRLEVEVIATDGPSLPVDVGRDGTLHRRAIGLTSGLADPLGAELTLYWIEGYGGGLFLPFRDATSGHQTYGGGRYLLDAIKGADLGVTAEGRLILDFNFAYHPSCALNPAWLCPLSPVENTLPVAVRGGERL